MATTITGIFQAKVLSNLDTYNHTALQTSMYTVNCAVNEIPPSGAIIDIKQNGTTQVSTTSAPAATQQLVQLQTILNCAASDLISVVVRSAVASEAAPNQIKGILKITPGQV